MSFTLARLFGYTRLLEYELRRERILRRRDELRHERERQRLIDAVQRAANKPTVFERPETTKASSVPPVAFGPTMSRARQDALEREAKKKEGVIIERATAVASNGHSVDAVEIPNE